MDIEPESWTSPFDALVEMGIALPPLEDLTDGQLSAKLWEVIEALAFLGVYLEHTDHLSDRELYSQLWNEELREASMMCTVPAWRMANTVGHSLRRRGREL